MRVHRAPRLWICFLVLAVWVESIYGGTRASPPVLAAVDRDKDMDKDGDGRGGVKRETVELLAPCR